MIFLIPIILCMCLCCCISLLLSSSSGALYYYNSGDSTIAWKCITGMNVPLRKNSQGDVECMSQNGRDCLWQPDQQKCNELIKNPPSNINPLVCGDMHDKVWGGKGYDNPEHWCAKAKNSL